MLVLDDKPAPIRNAEHYRQHRQQLANKGATKKPHAISTKNNIRGIKIRWKKYDVSMAYTLWARVLTKTQVRRNDGRRPAVFPSALYESRHHDIPKMDTRRVPCAEKKYPSRILEGLEDAISTMCWV
jgi:hypothetical protein